MSIPKQEFESTPANYFEDFQMNLSSKIEEEEIFDWNSLPILSSLSKSDGFTIPKNYFDNLQKKSFERTATYSLNRIFRPLAASIILLIACMFIFNSMQSLDIIEDNAIDLTDSDLFIDYYLQNFEELEDLDINSINSFESGEDLFSQIEDENLINYLISESDIDDLEFIL